MITVHEYVVELSDYTFILCPADAELLHAAEAAASTPELHVWARVDTTKPMTRRQLRIARTGHPNAEGTFFMTVFFRDVPFHIFDLGEAQRYPRSAYAPPHPGGRYEP